MAKSHQLSLKKRPLIGRFLLPIKNMNQLVRDTELARKGLYKALSAEGNPTISKALDFKLSVQPAFIASE